MLLLELSCLLQGTCTCVRQDEQHVMAVGPVSGVIFDHFCVRCYVFLNRNAQEDPAYTLPWFHSMLGGIIKSVVQSGCHLCSILVRCIENFYSDEPDQNPVSLFVKGNALRIQVGTDSARHTPLLRPELLDDNDLGLVNDFRQYISTTDRKQRTGPKPASGYPHDFFIFRVMMYHLSVLMQRSP